MEISLLTCPINPAVMNPILTLTYSLNLFDDRILGITEIKISRTDILKNLFLEMLVYFTTELEMEKRQEMGLVRCKSLAWNDLCWPLETSGGRNGACSAGTTAFFPLLPWDGIGLSPILPHTHFVFLLFGYKWRLTGEKY